MAKEMPENREWKKSDEYQDRGVTERPVSKNHWNRDDPKVDAVPGLHWRPGSRN